MLVSEQVSGVPVSPEFVSKVTREDFWSGTIIPFMPMKEICLEIQGECEEGSLSICKDDCTCMYVILRNNINAQLYSRHYPWSNYSSLR
ncbi:hypothetical protein NPIL_595111 [Nephila pilipes]|uniref:Uncharacterized protein n=1 Tax=Nephila pilipes TaxID=299642 RepID=A0A8X6KFN5_NEPPI|nr:hypothetical protein NPIL_595111 [Nephila pilipes]